MAVLRKRLTKNGFVYEIDVTHNRRRRVISTRTSDRRIALKILNEIQGRIALGHFNMNQDQRKEITLSDFMNREYFPYAEGVKKRSTVDMERPIARELMTLLGSDRNLRSIHLRDIEQWMGTLIKRGLRPATINIHRRVVHCMFNVALKWEYIDRNPVSKVAKLKVEEKRNYFMEEEAAKIFELIDKDLCDPTKEYLKSFNELFRDYVEFLLNTGLRRNEAIFLKMSDVDLGRNIVYVEKTKGNAYRPIPLNTIARAILVRRGEKLFSELKPETATHKFNDMLKRIGLAAFKLHSLRHTFATRLVSAGVDILAVKELLGHQDIRTSMVYAKADTELLKRAVFRLENRLLDRGGER